MSAQLTILSMGWGRQTWALAAMMALDEIPRADFIVHSDTTHEHEATYAFRREWEPWLGEHGLTVVTVTAKRTDVVVEEWSNSVMIPAFTASASGDGQVRRQCTHDWKITPIRAFIRAELTRRGLKPKPGIVCSQQGISLDEAATRMRTSDVAYITNRYPLVDMKMTRSDCVTWLQRHGLPVPPKSACTFCPYKSIERWRMMKRAGGSDWREAVAIDLLIREKRSNAGQLLYVHPGRRPVDQAVTIPEDSGAKQAALWVEDDPSFEAVCDDGYCGV